VPAPMKEAHANGTITFADEDGRDTSPPSPEEK
jgi:hypothetical protein